MLLNLLRADGYFTVNKALARNIGLNAAIIYSELISKYIFFENKKKLTKDGWFFCTIEDLEESTTLSRNVQEKEIKKLEKFGLIKKQTKGLPARRFFLIIQDEKLIMKYLKSAEKARGCQIAENQQTGLLKNNKLDSQKAANRFTEKQQEELRYRIKDAEAIPEITTKIINKSVSQSKDNKDNNTNLQDGDTKLHGGDTNLQDGDTKLHGGDTNLQDGDTNLQGGEAILKITAFKTSEDLKNKNNDNDFKKFLDNENDKIGDNSKFQDGDTKLHGGDTNLQGGEAISKIINNNDNKSVSQSKDRIVKTKEKNNKTDGQTETNNIFMIHENLKKKYGDEVFKRSLKRMQGRNIGILGYKKYLEKICIEQKEIYQNEFKEKLLPARHSHNCYHDKGYVRDLNDLIE